MKTILSILMAFGFQSAFAAPATSYNCVGTNAFDKEGVVFELLFANHTPEAGYTNQSITITKRGWKDLEKPIVLQMFGATDRNNCQTRDGEVYMSTDFKMEPIESEGISGYGVAFKSMCGGEHNFDVKGYCLFQ